MGGCQRVSGVVPLASVLETPVPDRSVFEDGWWKVVLQSGRKKLEEFLACLTSYPKTLTWL
jgi:hypothetical protein